MFYVTNDCYCLSLCIESPKHQGKPSTRSAKNYGVSYAPSHPLKGRNIVVVSQKSMLDDGEEDSEILNLGVIANFLQNCFDLKLIPHYLFVFREYLCFCQSFGVRCLQLIQGNQTLLIALTVELCKILWDFLKDL